MRRRGEEVLKVNRDDTLGREGDMTWNIQQHRVMKVKEENVSRRTHHDCERRTKRVQMRWPRKQWQQTRRSE